MKRSFYHYMMRFRGDLNEGPEKKLADWMFHEHSFPKQPATYDELSAYLEYHSPFPGALAAFDHLYDSYLEEER